MEEEPRAPERRPSRLRLYAPFIALGLLAAGWSVAWVVFRGATVAAIDGWVADEAAAGRRWTCQDRSVAGYPFRIEVGCASLGFERPGATASLGRLQVVAQVYSPRHIIAEAAGPLTAVVNGQAAEATWTGLRASIVTGRAGLERLALVAEAPSASYAPATGPPLTLASRRLETHVRPAEAGRDTWEASIRTQGSSVALLDDLVGGREPADIDLALTASRVADLPARPIPAELERWRLAGGRVDITTLRLAKGPRRLEATGTLGLDDQHRPQVEAQAAALGLGGLLGRFADDRALRLAERLGAVLGSGAAPRRPDVPGEPRLTPLPPLRVSGGRLYLGRIPVPLLDFPPLY